VSETILHQGPADDPPSGLTYPLVLRPVKGFSIAFGILTALAGFVVVVRLVTELVLRVGYVLRGGGDYAAYSVAALSYQLPEGLLAGHLGLASLILVALAVSRFLHGRRPMWTFSVQPGMRWRYLLVVFIVALVLLNGMLWLSFTWAGLPQFNSGQLYAGWFVLVVLFSSPLQAVAEEVFFRGYLLQAIGSGTGRAWLGIVGSSLVFALMHGVQNPALFAHRFAFGIISGWLVLATGGLEAGIAAHIVNNLGAFGYAIFTTSVAEARAIQEIGWDKAAWDTLTFALFAVAAWWIAGRMRLARTTP
jgi:uncharacterized protein